MKHEDVLTVDGVLNGPPTDATSYVRSYLSVTSIYGHNRDPGRRLYASILSTNQLGTQNF